MVSGPGPGLHVNFHSLANPIVDESVGVSYPTLPLLLPQGSYLVAVAVSFQSYFFFLYLLIKYLNQYYHGSYGLKVELPSFFLFVGHKGQRIAELFKELEGYAVPNSSGYTSTADGSADWPSNPT